MPIERRNQAKSDSPQEPDPSGFGAVTRSFGVLVILGLVFFAYCLTVGSPWASPQSHLPLQLNIVRRGVDDRAVTSTLKKMLTIEQQEQVMRLGYGVVANCDLVEGGKPSRLASTVIANADADPSLDKGRIEFQKAEERLASAFAHCNAVVIERVLVFVDRTRRNIDQDLLEQVKRRLDTSEADIYGALNRRNGVEVSFHVLGSSVFSDNPQTLLVPPLSVDQGQEEVLGTTRNNLAKVLGALFSSRMGENDSALSSSLAHVLSEVKPREGTRILIFSDFIENDKHTIRLSGRDISALVQDNRTRSEIKASLERMLVLPKLNGVQMHLYLFPVPSELANMKAMAALFSEAFTSKGATVETHAGR